MHRQDSSLRVKCIYFWRRLQNEKELFIGNHWTLDFSIPSRLMQQEKQ